LAYAINDAGQIVGTAPYGGSCSSYAFLLSQSVVHPIGIGSAYGINANGEVVGLIQAGDAAIGVANHAFNYNLGGKLTDMGTLPGDTNSSALGINTLGMIVGTSQYEQIVAPFATVSRAFLFNGVMIDLNTFIGATDPLQPFVKLTNAQGINDSGLVVANGADSRSTALHAYLVQVPLLQVSPGPLLYASQTIGTTSQPQSVTFTNVGTSSIVLGTPTIAGSFVIQSNTCAMSLAASASCSIGVAYASRVTGDSSGGLTLPANGDPILVPLSPANATISADSSSTLVGSPVTLTWAAPTGANCSAIGGSTADGWSGQIAANGTQKVAESAPGTYGYGITCIVGSQIQTAQLAPLVTVTWPTVTATLAASPTTVVAGLPTTLTWKSSNATSCVSSGGGPNDGWPSNRATSGSVAISEPFAISTSTANIIYTITCTDSTNGQSATATATVVLVKSSSSGGGGGSGALGADALVLLGALVALRAQRQRIRRAGA
jgi:probable HAF family extracellular repeat protein